MESNILTWKERWKDTARDKCLGLPFRKSGGLYLVLVDEAVDPI